MRELLDLITIGETYFFRNKAQFDVLMKVVLPEMIQRKADSGDKCIRTWSAGCSRGDEPYSIAIAIMEVLPSYKEWTISIFGTDINRNGLVCAKEAIYGAKDIGHLPKEYLDKYFEIRGSTYLLRSDVRELVQVEYHNLVKDPYIHEGMQNIDLVFCRNVTIYFDYQTTRRVIDNFYNCLAPEGYLFLGHAETLWQISNKFERIEFPQTFIYKKGLGLVPEDAMRPFVALPEIPIEDLTSTKEAGTEKRFFLQGVRSEPQGEGLSLRQIEKPCASLSSPDQGIAPDKNQMVSDLAKATILANEAKYKEAADVLARVIEEDNLSVEAYYLLGALSCKSGDLKEAETQFRKVIYVDPDSVLAYFNLGNIYLYQRRFSRAAREFRNAARLLGKRPKDEQIRFCEDFTVEFLLRACRKNLVEISRRGELI
jgi:chemotaxis protein methyltransferase CheR